MTGHYDTNVLHFRICIFKMVKDLNRNRVHIIGQWLCSLKSDKNYLFLYRNKARWKFNLKVLIELTSLELRRLMEGRALEQPAVPGYTRRT
jgi:hypothetical protein